jgi:hypothetical protein
MQGPSNTSLDPSGISLCTRQSKKSPSRFLAYFSSPFPLSRKWVMRDLGSPLLCESIIASTYAFRLNSCTASSSSGSSPWQVMKTPSIKQTTKNSKGVENLFGTSLNSLASSSLWLKPPPPPGGSPPPRSPLPRSPLPRSPLPLPGSSPPTFPLVEEVPCFFDDMFKAAHSAQRPTRP